MNGFTLCMWISLIVILNVRGEGGVEEISTFCEHCNNSDIPECTIMDEVAFTTLIECPPSELSPCTLATNKFSGVEVNEAAKNITEDSEVVHMCLLKKSTTKIAATKNLSNARPTTISNEAEETKDPGENSMLESTTPEVSEDSLKLLPFAEETAIDRTTPRSVIETTLTSITQDITDHEDREEVLSKQPQADEGMPEENPSNDNAGKDVINKSETTENNKGHEIVAVGEQFKCFGCSNTDDDSCSMKPKNEIVCKTVKDKRMGCFTLVKGNTGGNATNRGCITELTIAESKLCATKRKLCTLCYESKCNDDNPSRAPSIYIGNGVLMLTLALILQLARQQM